MTDADSAASGTENRPDDGSAATGSVPAEYLDEWLESIHSVVDEARIEFDTDGVHALAVDPANVSMIEATLDSSALLDYETNGIATGVNIRRLREVLEHYPGSVNLAYYADGRDLQLIDSRRVHTMRCIDPGKVRKADELPPYEPEVEVDVAADELADVFQLADRTTDKLEFEFDTGDGMLQVSVEGSLDSGTYTVEPTNVRENGNARAVYSTDYLQEVLEPLHEGQTVTVGFTDHKPVIFEYGRAPEPVDEGSGVYHGNVRTWVAPRLDTEDSL